MAQIRGTAGYQLSNQTPFGGPRMEGSDPSPLDAIRAQTSKIEDILDNLSGPVKPYVNTYYIPRCATSKQKMRGYIAYKKNCPLRTSLLTRASLSIATYLPLVDS